MILTIHRGVMMRIAIFGGWDEDSIGNKRLTRDGLALR